MPDGIQPPIDTTAPELAAEAADGRLVRRVRRNLVLWSGGTTLLVLLALAVALYAAVAGSLANAGIAQLDARMSADPRRAARPATTSPGTGSSSAAAAPGRYALIVDPDGDGRHGASRSASSARAARTRTRVACGRGARPRRPDRRRSESTPVRILTQTVDVDGADVHGPGHPGPDGRAADAPDDARRPARRRRWSSCSSPSGSGRSTPAARSSRSASRWPTSGRRSAASASSPPTPATSCARR